MTVHKLNPERTAGESRPFNVGVTFQHDLYDLAEAVFKTRALQAFESAATRYPIHRLIRFAVRRKLEDVFDGLALETGLSAQRLDTGSLILDGPGAFVHADGTRKSGYCSCSLNIWAESKAKLEDVRAIILRTVGERHLPEETFVIDWNFSNSRGALVAAKFEELANDVLHDEAYPTLGESVTDFTKRYVEASETVLILQGSPGSGKTRLVRAILGAMSRRKGESAEVMYTADKRALENDEIFVDFITGSHDAFVIEDADHMLMTRNNGNVDLHRFLTIADGVVRAQGRKIIFTTNLPNIGDIDDALRRPGRCFAIINTRVLNMDEVARLITRLSEGNEAVAQAAQARLVTLGTKGASVADVYRACANAAREIG